MNSVSICSKYERICVAAYSPIGPRGTNTSDLIVDGMNYDVYTPSTSDPSRIISAIVKKDDQAAGIVVDLSNTTVTKDQLGDVMKRVRNAGAKNIVDVQIIERKK